MSLLRRILLLGKAGGGKKPIDPAWCYWDAIGTVDMREQGGYYEMPSGTGAIFAGSEAPSGWAGWYFDRQ